MDTSDMLSTAIAIISLCVSIYVVMRDKTTRKYDILHQAYSRLSTIMDKVSEQDHNFDYGNEEERFKQELISSSNQHRIERELEFVCYYIYKEQIELQAFFDLFGPWLAARHRFWSKHQPEMKTAHPYTWKAIEACTERKLLPLDQNKEFWKIRPKPETKKKPPLSRRSTKRTRTTMRAS